MNMPPDSPRPIVSTLKRAWRRQGRVLTGAALAGAAGVAAGRVLKDRSTDGNWNRGKQRAKNALITGAAGGYLGSLVDHAEHGPRWARAGAAAGALAGLLNRPKRKSTTAASVASGGDWNFEVLPPAEDLVDDVLHSIKFGLLGAGKPGDYRRPHVIHEAQDIPPGAAVTVDRSILSRGGVSKLPAKARGRAVAGGIVATGPKVSDAIAKASGYESPAAVNKAGLRHEPIHTIQASKRPRTSIRHLLRDEIGAYGSMNRDLKGMSWRRALNNVAGVGVSTAAGTAANPVLRNRLALRGKQAAAIAVGTAGAGLLAKAVHRKEPTKFGIREDTATDVPKRRDNWDRARDAALTAGGIATVGAAGIATARGGRMIAGLAKRGRAALRKANLPGTASNMRNATSVYADVGRVYNRAKTNAGKAVGEFRKGMAEGATGKVPGWKAALMRVPGVARVSKAIGLSEFAADPRPAERRWRDRLDVVKAGLGVGTGVAGILAAKKIGNAGRDAIGKLTPLVKGAWDQHVQPAVVEARKTATAWRHAAKSVSRNVAKIATVPDRLPQILGGTGKEALKSPSLVRRIGARIGVLSDARGSTAMSAFLGDCKLKDLPKEVQTLVKQFTKVNPDTQLSRYGMVLTDLIPKADPSNLQTAREHLKKTSKTAATKSFFAKRDGKFILVLNDRVVDGHHFIATAERAGVTSSLHVVDLTPVRFQLSAAIRNLVSFDRGDHLDERGRHVSAWDVFTGKKKSYETKLNPNTGRHEVDINSAKNASLLDAAGAVHAKAKVVSRWAGRGSGLLRDVKDTVTGAAPRRDASGRTQKKEWQKPWFERHAKELVTTAALVGGGLAYRRSPMVRQQVDRARAAGEGAMGKVRKWAEDRIGSPSPLHVAAAPASQRPATTFPKGRAFVAPPIAGKRKVAQVADRARRPGALKKGDLYAQPPSVKKPWSTAPGEMPRHMSAAIEHLCIMLDDASADAGWDVRDPRGRSARVFAPGSGRRDRREKRWYEHVGNERKLWAVGLGAAALAGGGLAAEVLKKKPGLVGLRPPVKAAVRSIRAPKRLNISNVIPMRAPVRPIQSA